MLIGKKTCMNRIVDEYTLNLTSVVNHYYKIFRTICKERDGRTLYSLNKEYVCFEYLQKILKNWACPWALRKTNVNSTALIFTFSAKS